ncbi:unnamed protein product, partial [Amoebophrya sp. A25]
HDGRRVENDDEQIEERYLRHYWLFPRRSAPEGIRRLTGECKGAEEMAVQSYVDTEANAEKFGRMLIPD